MGLFDALANFLKMGDSVEISERRNHLIAELQNGAGKLRTYSENLSGIVYSYSYKDLTENC